MRADGNQQDVTERSCHQQQQPGDEQEGDDAGCGRALWLPGGRRSRTPRRYRAASSTRLNVSSSLASRSYLTSTTLPTPPSEPPSARYVEASMAAPSPGEKVVKIR